MMQQPDMMQQQTGMMNATPAPMMQAPDAVNDTGAGGDGGAGGE